MIDYALVLLFFIYSPFSVSFANFMFHDMMQK